MKCAVVADGLEFKIFLLWNYWELKVGFSIVVLKNLVKVSQ